jgi:anti-sigma factor RsiW
LASTHELSCQEIVELVTDYLEDALSPAHRRQFEEHLAECDDCTTYLKQMRQTIRLTGTLTEEAVPHEAKEKLLRAFRSWRRGS